MQDSGTDNSLNDHPPLRKPSLPEQTAGHYGLLPLMCGCGCCQLVLNASNSHTHMLAAILLELCLRLLEASDDAAIAVPEKPGDVAVLLGVFSTRAGWEARGWEEGMQHCSSEPGLDLHEPLVETHENRKAKQEA